MKEDERKRLRARRKRLSAIEVQEASQAVALKVVHGLRLTGDERVHAYTPVKGSNEIDSREIMGLLSRRYPALTVVWGDPSSGATIPVGSFDVIFVPLVGFDRGRFRLGYGGGWYDRFLGTQPKACKIGLAYDWQRADFTAEAHDVALDLIVTPEGWL